MYQALFIYFWSLVYAEFHFWIHKIISYVIIGPSYNVFQQRKLVGFIFAYRRAELNTHWQKLFFGINEEDEE